MSRDLSWSDHVSLVVAKAYKVLGLLHRSFHSAHSSLHRLLHTSLIRSQLTYCCQVWRLHLLKDIQALGRVQQRAMKWIPLHLAQDPLVLNSSIDTPVHLPLVIIILLIFPPLELSYLSQFALHVYSSTSLHSQASLMVSLSLFFWWFHFKCPCSKCLFLCHCTPNYIFSSLLINFSPQFIRHLFISLLFNLFISIHSSLIIHSLLITSTLYSSLGPIVFVLVSH